MDNLLQIHYQFFLSNDILRESVMNSKPKLKLSEVACQNGYGFYRPAGLLRV